MIVYIEQVLIDNLFINYLLLFLVAKFLSLEKKFWRLGLGSLTGTIFAILFPLFNFGGVVLVVLKILLGFVIITISFEYKTLKKCLLILFTFIAVTAVMGGIIFGLLFAVNPNLQLENGTFVYTSTLPIGVYIFIVMIVTKILADAFTYADKKSKIKKYEYNMSILNQNKIYNIKVFLDTGNLLVDSNSGKPIIVISFKIFQKLFDIKTVDFLTGHYKIPNSRYLKTDSALGKSNMLLFEVDGVIIKDNEKEKQIDKAVLGLGKANFYNTLGCDAIMGRQIFD